MRDWLRNLYRSFSFQLMVLHLRSHHLLLGLWLILVFLISGVLGRRLGAHYLFLDPEYLGRVDFWSFLFLGLALGGFYMTWNLTTYLLSAHYFPFLASLLRPFTKFCLNNFAFPLAFFVFYLGMIIHFETTYEGLSFETIFLNTLGLFFGAMTLILFNFIYFYFTNKDISSYEKASPPPHLSANIAPGRRTTDPDFIKQDRNRWRVKTYLTESFRPRMVRSVAHYDSRLLMNIFKQNHLNALIIQLLSMIVLVMLGQLIEYPVFRIPAAASLFILASIITAILGALIYWFNEWWVTMFIVLLVGINYLTSFEMVRYRNKAYGMDYTAPPATYAYDSLQKMFLEKVDEDTKATQRILENWRERVAPDPDQKPKMVIICVSGGGLRSAIWAMQVIQRADSLAEGKLLPHTVLITGASGGMMGTAYLRERYLRRLQGDTLHYYDARYLDDISKDILNPVAFAIVSNDLFLPWASFSWGGHRYRKDRGYVFEQQFNENTNGILDKPLADYHEPEREALIPMLYLTPSIVNDARRLIISPHGATFMMLPPVGPPHYQDLEIDAVDFRGLFAEQGAGNLRFLSALRMNATYPYILPNVHLPSQPGIEAMDAGFRDNYGIMTATRFIQVFQDWIRAYTSGVILLQISTSEKIEAISPSDNKGMIESLLNPLGIAGQILSLQEFEQDNSLGFIFDLLGQEQFEIIHFLYRPTQANKLEASVSFHLTDAEKENVLSAIDLPENQSSLRQLVQALHPPDEQ